MKLIKILSVVIVALVLGSVTLANRSVDESLYVADLTRTIHELENQNLARSSRVAMLGSLTQLKDKIVDAGFVDTPLIVALPTPTSVALR